MARMQELWIQASSSCCVSRPHVLEEIQDIEKRLKALESQKALENNANRTG